MIINGWDYGTVDAEVTSDNTRCNMLCLEIKKQTNKKQQQP